MITKKLDELYFSSPDRANREVIRKLKEEGKIRKIGPKLFTSINNEDDLETYLKKNWSQVLDKLYPGSHISFRTAFEFKPAEEGYLFLTSSSERLIEYPGLKIKFVTGPKTISSDGSFIGSLQVSSFERAILENLSTVSSKWSFRNIDQIKIEKKLEEIMKIKGEEDLNTIRDKSREISKELGLEKAFKKLDQIIGALLSTKESYILKSSEGKKRAEGRPFDVNCVSKLEVLFGELRTSVFKHRIEKSNTNEHFINKAFFESYFSNYIEGTTFEIEEAEEIIFDKKIIEARTKDSHDILGVFNIVSDLEEMKRTPSSYQDLIEIIKRRHFIMMKERPEVEPGKFKEKVNRAGNTTFVHPDDVIGTLEKGFEIYSSLKEIPAKAIFISYLISEVHPFNDGNGRLCRIMFNSELAKAGLSTLIIPTVYREDYLLSLRALSRRERVKPLIKMFTRALKFSNLDFSNYSQSLKSISDNNWFLEPNEGKLIEDD